MYRFDCQQVYGGQEMPRKIDTDLICESLTEWSEEAWQCGDLSVAEKIDELIAFIQTREE